MERTHKTSMTVGLSIKNNFSRNMYDDMMLSDFSSFLEEEDVMGDTLLDEEEEEDLGDDVKTPNPVKSDDDDGDEEEVEDGDIEEDLTEEDGFGAETD